MALPIKGNLQVLAALTARRVNKGLIEFSESVTLSKSAAAEYYFTGSAAADVNLPESGVLAGWPVLVQNVGSADVTIQVGANQVAVVKAGRRVEVVAKSAAPAAAADWLVREIATDAVDVDFDPSNSENLDATNVQAAIDELAGLVGDADGDLSDLYAVLGLNENGGLDENFAGFGDEAPATSTYLAAINQLLDGAIHKDGSVAMEGDLDLGSNKIVNVADPENAQDAATKKYVDDEIDALEDILVKGISWQTRVLGIYETAPTVGLEGDPLADGDRYINSDDKKVYVREDGAWVVAVDAPDAGMAAPDLSAPNTVLLFDGDDWGPVYWESTEAGDGLQMGSGSDSFKISIDPDLAGAGLSYDAGVLSVNLGDGLELDSDNVRVKLDGVTLARSGDGIKVNIADSSLEEDGGLKVKLDPAGAIGLDASDAGLEVLVDGASIEIDSNALRIASGAAGDGLGYDAGVLSITGGDGIVVDATGLAIDLDTDSGLNFNDGKLRTDRHYEQSFANTDFSAPGDGLSELSIPATTHGQGTQPFVHLYENDGSVFKEVKAEELSIDASGDIKIVVVNEGEGLDGRFDGKIKIVKSYV